MTAKRPDMRNYFRARIDQYVHGMMSVARATLPYNVVRISGDVTDRDIVATMNDGTVWHWSGGRYATRKVNGCYAPLMPRAD